MTKRPEQARDLKPNPKNPRKIDDDALSALGRSMHLYGDLSGIVFNRRTGHLIGGHQRMRHLPEDAQIELVGRRSTKTNAQGTVAVGFVTLDGERWNYREVDVDERVETEMNIAANAQRAAFDETQLAEFLTELASVHDDERMAAIGFGADDLKRLVGWHDGHAAVDETGQIDEKYAILIECESEYEQNELLERFIADGLKCRALLS